MKVELRSVKLLKSLSEETPAYTGVVYVDGKPFAQVRNHGQGGCDEVHPVGKAFSNDPAFHKRLAEVEAYFKSLPKVASEFIPEGLEQSLELFCHTEVWDQDLNKVIVKDLANNVCYVKADGKLYLSSLKKVPAEKRAATIEAWKKQLTERGAVEFVTTVERFKAFMK